MIKAGSVLTFILLSLFLSNFPVTSLVNCGAEHLTALSFVLWMSPMGTTLTPLECSAR